MQTGHESLYNKYRPKTFDGIIGQQVPVAALTDDMRNGRIANAYLMSGPRGTGKTTSARVFSKSLLCTGRDVADAEPCGRCQSCLDFDDGVAIDYQEIDGGSNKGIDNIRDVIAWASLPPQVSRHRVVVIDEVHLLTREAVSALLKTLEEPPASSVFILCTTDPQKVPDTIISRCKWLRFSLVRTDEISRLLSSVALSEGIQLGDGVADEIARQSHGGVRDALSLLDTVRSASNGSISMQTVADVLGSDAWTRQAGLIDAIASRDMTKVITFVSREDSDDDVVSLVDAVSDAMSVAIITRECGGSASDHNFGSLPEGALQAVDRLASAWDVPSMVHARDVIDESSWKLSEARFVTKHVYASMMVKCLDPSTDPSCSLFGTGTSHVPDVPSDGVSATSAGVSVPGIDAELASLHDDVSKTLEASKALVKIEKAVLGMLKEQSIGA